MKTIEAVSLFKALLAVSNRKAPSKFSYAAGLMISRLQPIDAAYEKTRGELLEQYGEKDEKGQLKLDKATNTHPLTDADAFRAAIEQLQDEPVDVTVHKVALEHFPTEIEPGLMVALMPMVAEEAAKPA